VAAEQVAGEAAELLPDDASLFLDAGASVEFTARVLNKSNSLTVLFTNCIRAVLAFDPKRNNVTVLGSCVAGSDGSLVSEEMGRVTNFDLSNRVACQDPIDPAYPRHFREVRRLLRSDGSRRSY